MILLCGALLVQPPAGAQEKGPGKKLSIPRPAIFMWGYSDPGKFKGKPGEVAGRTELPGGGVIVRVDPGGLWKKTLRTVNVVEGLTAEPELVLRLRKEGKVFAWHVVNTIKVGDTADSIVKKWSEPFRNTFAGRLPGGFDAISIDELHPWPDGDKRSELAIKALAELKRRYPDRLVIAAVRWQLAASGSKRVKGEIYDRQLRAIRDHVDLVFLECYLNETNPQFHLFAELADNIEKRAPGIIEKTIYGLAISQNVTFPYADSSPYVEFGDFLDKQLHTIRNHPLGRKMPGVGYWVFYRARPVTVLDVLDLSRHYYLEGKTGYFGDGDYTTVVKSPSFERRLTAWKIEGKGAEVISYKDAPGITAWHSATFASHGNRVLRMVGSKEGCGISQEVKVLPDTTYILSAWVATRLNSGGGLSYSLRGSDVLGGGGGVAGMPHVSCVRPGRPGNHRWQRIDMTISTGKCNILKLSLRDPRPGKTIYYDFIQLERGHKDIPGTRHSFRDW